MQHVLPWLVGLVVAGLGLYLQWRALRSRARAALLRDLPQVPAASVSVGLFEVAGRTHARRALTSRLAGAECVLHRWSVAEEYRRVRQTTRRGVGGRSETVTEVDQGWQRIAGDGESPAFEVVDDSGSVRVLPQGARLELATFLSEVVGAADARYAAHAPARAVPGSTGRRRLLDEGLPLGAQVFVVGRARWRGEAAAPEFAEDPEAPLFEVSVRGERAVQRRYRAGGVAALVFGTLLLSAAIWLLLRAAGAEAESRDLGHVGRCVLGGLAATAALQLAGWVLLAYNSAVDLAQRVARASSGIEIELQRRADLLPGLVALVDAERGHEREVQAALAALRRAVDESPEGRPGADPRSVSEPLAVIVEACPELDSDASFRALADALTAAEDRLARSRSTYNDFATSFNLRRARFPAGWIVARVRVAPFELLVADAFRARARVD